MPAYMGIYVLNNVCISLDNNLSRFILLLVF